MKYGLRLGVIVLLAIAGLAGVMLVRHGARADVDNTEAISCIFFSAVLNPADACDGLDAQDIQIVADTLGDQDGTLELTDVENLDLDANQITDASAAEFPWLSTIYVIAFVDNDGSVTFDADTGVTVEISDDGSTDDPAPADDANVETCDGDDDADCGTSTLVDGDGVVVATITDQTADPGDAIDVVVEQDGEGSTETLAVVGAPDEVDLTLVESVVRSRETGSDCASGDPHVTDADALANLDSTLALAVVTDSDGTPLTRIVTTMSSDDSDIAEIGDTTVVTVDAGGSGIASITVICGSVDTGAANINVDIIGGENDSETITVTGEPASIALAASPAAIDCDGDQPATVTATVVDENGNIVANGTPVTFSVVAFGVADPVNTTTFDGVASSSIYPVAGNTVGITVVVSSGDASAFIRIECGEVIPSPPPGRPRAIQLKATPERIACDGNEPSRIRVRVLDDNDQPVLDGTYVEFVTEGDGFGSFSEQQVVTNNGVATTDVRFQAYDPAFPPFAFDVRATAGMLSGSIRVYCGESTGCVSPPPAPGDAPSPPCEPNATPTSQPAPDCERGNSGRIVSPPCNQPARPLSPPRCENSGRGQGRGNQQCGTPTPPSPPECAVSPPAGSVSPPCPTPTPEPPSPPPCEWPFSPPGCGLVPCSLDTSVSPPVFECAFSPTATASATPTTTPTATRTPLPARMALDCDVETAGIQEACGPLPDGTSSTDVAIVLENETNQSIFVSVFDARVASPADDVLRVVSGPGGLDGNPNFNQAELGNEWGCNIFPDFDPSDVVSPFIECFSLAAPVAIGPFERITLATVRYEFDSGAGGANGHVDLVTGDTATEQGHELAACRSCASVDIQLPGIIPVTTSTPTATPVPEETHAPALESIDATGTPADAYFVALDCDLNNPGLQDQCSYALDAGVIDVGFVVIANFDTCLGCNLAAFNFVVTDPDRSRLDPPLGSDAVLDANPDFNQSLLSQLWFCVPPAPDNNRLPDDSPQAESFLSCYAVESGAPLSPNTPALSATIRYVIPDGATPGEVTLALGGVSVGDIFGNELAGCLPSGPEICRPATITLVDRNSEAPPTNTAVPTATPTKGGGLIPFEITFTPTAVPTATPTPNGSGLIPLACADVTGDSVVDIEDAVAITSRVGKRNARYDITHDDKVNVKDILAAVRQLNRTC